MKVTLTKEDIKKLNYQKRLGFLIGGLVFILGIGMSVLAGYESEDNYPFIIDCNHYSFNNSCLFNDWKNISRHQQ